LARIVKIPFQKQKKQTGGTPACFFCDQMRLFFNRITRGIFHAANAALHFTGSFFGNAFGLGFGVPRYFANGFLNGAFNLLGRTFKTILVHCETPLFIRFWLCSAASFMKRPTSHDEYLEFQLPGTQIAMH
jgi:hypothetical protein